MQNFFSHIVKIEDLSQNLHTYKVKATQNQLKQLAALLKVEAVHTFEASFALKLSRKNHRLDIEGVVDSTLTLQSVISLDFFEKTYHAPFKYYFDTALTYQGLKQLDFSIGDEAPDIVENGQIDLVQIAVEQLSLVMEDYPKQQGEEFCFTSEFDAKTTKKAHPFAALEKLKK